MKTKLLILFTILFCTPIVLSGVNSTKAHTNVSNETSFVLEENLMNISKAQMISITQYDLIKSGKMLLKTFDLSEDDENIDSELISFWYDDNSVFFEISMAQAYLVTLRDTKIYEPDNVYKKDNTYIIEFSGLSFTSLHVGKSSDVWTDTTYTAGGKVFYNMSNISTIVPNLANLSQFNGTANNGVTFFKEGICYVASFDGNNDYIQTNNFATSLTDDFTVSLWINLSSAQTYKRLFELGDSNDDRAVLSMDGTVGTKLSVLVEMGSSSSATDGTTAINNDTWHHVVFTWDESESKSNVYLNGNLEITNASGAGDVGSLVDKFFTVGTGDSNYLNGDITGFAIFDEIKNSSWINYVYSKGKCYQYDLVVIANETQGRSAINSGVSGSVLSSYTISTDRKVHVRLLNGTQYHGTFDKFVSSGSKRWALNYDEYNSSGFPSFSSIDSAFYVWQNATMTASAIQANVTAFINNTYN